MADTKRVLSALQALLADNITNDISPQDVRDLLVSVMNNYTVSTLSSGSPYTPTLDDGILRVTQAANYTIALPAAATAGWTGKLLGFKKLSTAAYTVTLDADGSELIDDDPTLVMTSKNQFVWIYCNGVGWEIY